MIYRQEAQNLQDARVHGHKKSQNDSGDSVLSLLRFFVAGFLATKSRKSHEKILEILLSLLSFLGAGFRGSSQCCES